MESQGLKQQKVNAWAWGAPQTSVQTQSGRRCEREVVCPPEPPAKCGILAIFSLTEISWLHIYLLRAVGFSMLYTRTS